MMMCRDGLGLVQRQEGTVTVFGESILVVNDMHEGHNNSKI